MVRPWIRSSESWRSSSETGSRSVRSWLPRLTVARRRAGNMPASSSNLRRRMKSLWSSSKLCAGRTKPTRVKCNTCKGEGLQELPYSSRVCASSMGLEPRDYYLSLVYRLKRGSPAWLCSSYTCVLVLESYTYTDAEDIGDR